MTEHQKKYFGTDGIRAKVGDLPMTPEFLMRLGYASGKLLANSTTAPILIARDTRMSGSTLQSALQAGITAAGVDVYDLGVLTTPAVAYLTRLLKASSGIVVSASHNPYFDNGVKFFDADGFKLSDEKECVLEEGLTQSFSLNKKCGSVRYLSDAESRYAAHCQKGFPELDLSGLRIVFDGANGAGYQVGPQVLKALGAEVITIACAPDGYNINHECGATALALLQRTVTENQADCGVAFDGDGDRLMMVDAQGEIVDGDEIVAILALEMMGSQPAQGVVGTLMSNLGLEQSLKTRGIPFERAAVGDRYVLAQLRQKGWRLGGENSGHIIHLDYATTGDALVGMLAVLNVMQQQQSALHQLKTVMQKRPQVLLNVRFSEQRDVVQTDEVQAAVTIAENALGDAGRVLLRLSGTEPCVRVMVEAEESWIAELHAQAIVNAVKSVIAKELS